VGVGVLATSVAATHRWVRRLGWVGVVLGTGNTPAALLGLGVLAGERGVVTRRLRYVVPFLAGAILIGGEAWLRRGDPTDQGYGAGAVHLPTGPRGPALRRSA